MGIDDLTHNDAGIRVAPDSPEAWRDWVSATRLRGYLLKNTLSDWLNLYGEENGFERDDTLDGYDERLAFAPFIMEQGSRFEEAVARHLSSFHELTTISREPDDVRELEVAQQTFRALADGRPILHQAVLWNPESRTYGAADFLIRSDVFDALFPGHLAPGEAATPAPDIGAFWHYVVVDAKFTTLHLSARGEVGNSGSSPAYKAQLCVYNAALGRLQGYTPRYAFLLGRSWEQGNRGRGTDAMERLGPVPMDAEVIGAAREAAEWVRRLRTEGRSWDPLPVPTVPELRPTEADWPWADATTRIIDALEDPIKLWQVGKDKRDAAIRAGIASWREGANAEAFGVTGSYIPRLEAILDVNRDAGGPPVRPARVTAAEGRWREPPPLEFFVDFEYVSDLNDNFVAFPQRGGLPVIFMIGCGHVENGQWKFAQFIADRLDALSEERAIDAWLAHMRETQRRLGSETANVFHWAPAEETNYETAYNSARKRHQHKEWPEVNWFDLLRHVIRAEPVVVRGAFAFGLKAVARAFFSHGLIETSWGDSPVDGMGAMVGAWRCGEEAAQHGVRLSDVPLMGEIAVYNEVDCKVMMEILEYLRVYH